MEEIISTQDLTKIFPPNVVAVNKISFSIKSGEIFSFLGPNGAGKTTTVRLLTTLTKPTSGAAYVMGYDIRDKEDALNIRKQIGILTDRPNLYTRLSAKRNLIFFAKMYGLTHEETLKRIMELVKEFNLEERIDSPVGSYSKGMKQKLGILRTLIHYPKIMFLDEPTSGLDPLAQEQVRETIEKTAADFDTTIFMTTHNLPEAERLADKIGIINFGRLITIGSSSDLHSKVKKVKKVIIRSVEKTNEYQEIIKSIVGIDSVQTMNDDHSLELSVTDFNKITPLIVETLVKNKISILEIRPVKTTLEEIYKQIMITGGVKDAA